jgi:predicted aconitase with swiveling domain
VESVIEIIPTEIVVAGAATGAAVAADVPLSFWGGLEPTTGEIIDRRHPLSGQIISGCVLVIPHGRGSCSASGVFLESIRNGFAPAAVITSRVDPIIGLGSILGDELYNRPVPIVVVKESDRATIRSGDLVTIAENGTINIVKPGMTIGG